LPLLQCKCNIQFQQEQKPGQPCAETLPSPRRFSTPEAAASAFPVFSAIPGLPLVSIQHPCHFFEEESLCQSPIS
jgi:hypothetical protein